LKINRHIDSKDCLDFIFISIFQQALTIWNAESVIQDCEIVQILPDLSDNDIFPGYEHVHLNWDDLKRVITKESWKTALQNQNEVYLLTDTSNGKQQVGSAYGQDIFLGRWQAYLKNGHGGNIGQNDYPFLISRSISHFQFLTSINPQLMIISSSKENSGGNRFYKVASLGIMRINKV
jgi:hypothetical protein